MDAVQLTAGDRQVARPGGPAAQHDRVELLAQIGPGQVAANLDAGMKLDAGAAHQVDAAIHQMFFQLHVGDAVHQQPADAVGAFVHRDQVAGAVELIGARQSRRPRSDHRHPLAGAHGRRRRFDPAGVEAALDDRPLGVLDGHRRLDDRQHAGRLAGRRAHLAGELREVVGLVQPVERVAPQPAVHQVVPLRNQVVERTADGLAGIGAAVAGVAERGAAIHAPGGLRAQLLVAGVAVKVLPVGDSRGWIPVRWQAAFDLLESGWLSHDLLVALRPSCPKSVPDCARFLRTPPSPPRRR